jgi:murein DD-endopeptidase MepM/ murein hydrolase activator NlpD
MIIPEREKGVRSWRIPRFAFFSASFIVAASLIALGVLTYDYWQVIGQIYENKHLNAENRLIKEELQVFRMKIDGLTDDLERIQVFEKKLRIITGLERRDLSRPWTAPVPKDEPAATKEQTPSPIEGKPRAMGPLPENSSSAEQFFFDDIKSDPAYSKLKNLYDEKIARSLQLPASYEYAQAISSLAQRSFSLASTFAEIDLKSERLTERMEILEQHINQLDKHLLDRQSFIASMPTLLPVHGSITSHFGVRQSPYLGRPTMHEGIDIGVNIGTRIIASADGIVSFAGDKIGLGRTVELDHGYGLTSIYAHNSSLSVHVGQKIKRGQLICKSGNTGYSTGPHLHYEIRVNGVPVDPLYYVLE